MSLVLVFLLSVSSPALAGSSANVKVQTVVVTPKVIVEPPAPPPALHAAPLPPRRPSRRRRARLIAARHVPRPLSPGEFGRTRPGL